MTPAMPPAAFEAAIRDVDRERYHDAHPFHKLLHGGHLRKSQVQAWALNRYCYQAAVPRKDAASISRVHEPGLRREWVRRLLDHDGSGDDEGASSGGCASLMALASIATTSRPCAARCRRHVLPSRLMCGSCASTL
jgi:coenzyme PQQ biosynthesis protein C